MLSRVYFDGDIQCIFTRQFFPCPGWHVANYIRLLMLYFFPLLMNLLFIQRNSSFIIVCAQARDACCIPDSSLALSLDKYCWSCWCLHACVGPLFETELGRATPSPAFMGLCIEKGGHNSTLDQLKQNEATVIHIIINNQKLIEHTWVVLPKLLPWNYYYPNSGTLNFEASLQYSDYRTQNNLLCGVFW